MEELKLIVAKNIVELRKKNNITQLELAQKLNYSDKAVSKWERGESLPDIVVLKNIADLFDVSVDYLLAQDHKTIEMLKPKKHIHNNRKLIFAMAAFLLLFFASLFTVIAKILDLNSAWYWLPYIYMIPFICIVSLVLNSLWFSRKKNYLIISFLLWSILISVYLSFLAFGKNLWILFILGIPGQGIISLWSGIRYKSNSN